MAVDSVTEQLRGTYDAVPYASTAFPNTSPDNIRTVAALAGIDAAPVTSCRVLEIGCAGGGNLAPMAQSLPASQFLGIDLSPRQIAQGNELIQKAGLTNIELRCQDLLDFKPDGSFDFIIAHGFYSWVPQNVRDRLLEVCAKSLAPNGVAFISYNTLPGWHLKRICRDMMQFHGRNESDPAARLAKARQILALVSESNLTSGFQIALNGMVENASQHRDFYLLHDDLELVNDPVYLTQFVAHAAAHNLAHVGSARPVVELLHELPQHVQEQINQWTTTAIEREQYADFLTGRTYRESLLCRSDASTRGPREVDAVRNMYIASDAVEEAVSQSPGAVRARFCKGNSTLKFDVSNPWLIAAMRHLIKSWPSAVSFNDLIQVAAATSPPDARDPSPPQSLAQGFFAAYRTEMVELWTRPTDFIDATSPERPLVAPWTRLQASRSEKVVNLRHHPLPADPIYRLLPLLDGTRTRADLCREVAGMIDRKELAALTASGDMNQILNHLLRIFSLKSLLWRNLAS